MATLAVRPGLFRSCSINIPTTTSKFQQMFRALTSSSKQSNIAFTHNKDFTVEGHLSRMINNETPTELQVIPQEQPVQEKLIDTMTLKVRSSDEAVLESYTQFVQRAANIFEMNSSGKIVLPMFVDKRTVNKSTQGHKKHRFQYELRTHGRGIKINQVTGDTTDLFLEYIQRMKPEGVSLSVESTELERMPTYLSPPEQQEDRANKQPTAADLL